MLKLYTAWLLIFAVITANCSRLFVYAGFKLNQSYISAKLCENRNKPWMHCNGHCYFMEKIRQANENKQKQGAKDQSPHAEIIFFVQPFKFEYLVKTSALKEAHRPLFPEDHYRNSFHSRIFQPPRAA